MRALSLIVPYMFKANPKYIDVKNLLRKNKYPMPFGGKYMFSPYMACGHACRYCDGRAERYHVDGDFDLDITVRQNSPELLAKELPSLRERGPICISSGISDPYQPIELNERLTRRCAEVLVEFDFPVTIHTKSALVMRDLDLWRRLHDKSAVHLMISLTFIEDDLRQIFEPGASPVAERLEALRQFHEAGIHTGVLAMPFIPFISDSEKQISLLFRTLADIGVDFVMPSGLTLRPGKQKELFLATAKKHFPLQFSEIQSLYHQNKASGAPIRSYQKELYKRTTALLEANHLSGMIPHYTYRNQFAVYDEIRILLSHMKSLYSSRGINTSRLSLSLTLFTEWLETRKTYYARRRNLPYRNLEDEIIALLSKGQPVGNPSNRGVQTILDQSFTEKRGFGEIIRNKKLATFLSSLFCDELTFDYFDLSLTKPEN